MSNYTKLATKLGITLANPDNVRSSEYSMLLELLDTALEESDQEDARSHAESILTEIYEWGQVITEQFHKTRPYAVTIRRTGHAYTTVTVTATSQREAEESALAQADDAEYTEKKKATYVIE